MFNCLRMVQPGNFLLSIHAKPGAKTSGFVGPLVPSEPAVEVRIAAPPVEGAANEELVSFMEETLDGAHRRGGWEAVAGASSSSGTSGGENDYSSNNSKKGKGGGSQKGGKGSTQQQQKQGPLPTKVRVSFHSGTTSRSKVLALELPCANVETAWSLIAAAAAE